MLIDPTRQPAQQAIDRVVRAVKGLPVYLAGSSYAAAKYDHIDDRAYSDVDLFCASIESLISAVERLRFHGYELSLRNERLYHRYLKYGVGKWHTNSIKLQHGTHDLEVNIIFKLVNRHPTTSLAQVLESYDFGLLTVGGVDCETGTEHDLRSYLFPEIVNQPGYTDASPLPLLPNKRDNWRNGFISQYNGLREIGRYVKYVDYGYDMSLVRDDLIIGYWSVAEYLGDRDEPEKLQLGRIYETIAIHLEKNNNDQLRTASQSINYNDSLDAIYEALE